METQTPNTQHHRTPDTPAGGEGGEGGGGAEDKPDAFVPSEDPGIKPVVQVSQIRIQNLWEQLDPGHNPQRIQGSRQGGHPGHGIRAQ